MLEGRSFRHALCFGGGITALEAALLLGAAFHDGNLWLPLKGLGLLQHFGVPAILLADFAVLAVLSLITQRFVRLPRRLPVKPEPANRRFIRLGVHRGLSTLLLKGPALRLFLLFAGLGVLFLAINAYQTTDAVTYYGNDVFDSSRHPYSYAVMRFVLGLSWIVLYPYAAVVLLGVSGNIYRMTAILKRRQRLTYMEFHPDGCVGFAYIGTISFLAILAILLLYLALMTVTTIHHKLNVLQVSGFVLLSAFFIALTYGISWPVTSFLVQARRTAKLAGYRSSHSKNPEFAVLKLLWILVDKPFSPYSAHQKIAINIVRLLPVTVAGIRLLPFL